MNIVGIPALMKVQKPVKKKRKKKKKEIIYRNLFNESCLSVNDIYLILPEIYRQKLQQSVADGELSDENVAVLLRLRVMLCIPQETVDAAHADICGRLFEKVDDSSSKNLYLLLCIIFFTITV